MKKGFYYANSVGDLTEKMSREKFYELMDNNLLNYRCGLIEKETDKEKRQKMKKYLPVILYNASFPKRNRKNEDAVPSGMMMLVRLSHSSKSPYMPVSAPVVKQPERSTSVRLLQPENI